MDYTKMILFQRIVSTFFIFIITATLLPHALSQEPGKNPPTEHKLTTYDYAAEIIRSFKSLPLLEYNIQCANPKLIKENVEYLVNDTNLTDAKIQESLTLLQRWKEHGGYRCNSSRYICMKETPTSKYTLYKCLCPLEKEEFMEYNSLIVDLGKQEVDPDGGRCSFKAGKTYVNKIPFNLTGFKLNPPSDPNNYISPSNLPGSAQDEIICGIYHKQIYKNVHLKTEEFTVDTGLYFNGIKCPGSLDCYVKEFNVECTQKNVESLYKKWIVKKRRTDRRAHWPVCACIDKKFKVEGDLPTEDPVENEIKELFADLSKAEFGQTCDNTEFETAKGILDANWYLYPAGAKADFEKLHVKVRSKGGLGCLETKGLVCDSKVTKKCICGPTPPKPGFSPEVPTEVNSNGYCQLDTNSDCDNNSTEFQCKDGENCLVARVDFECTDANVKSAKKKLEKDNLGNQHYLSRCRCTNAKIKYLKVQGSSCKPRSTWISITALVLFSSLRISTLL